MFFDAKVLNTAAESSTAPIRPSWRNKALPQQKLHRRVLLGVLKWDIFEQLRIIGLRASAQSVVYCVGGLTTHAGQHVAIGVEGKGDGSVA